MRAAVFWGCCILGSQYAYELSVREIMPKLGVELTDLDEALCCGDPVRSVNDLATTFLSARVLALANKTGLADLLVPCNRCHFALSEARRALTREEKARDKILGLLKEEGLEYDPGIRIWHVIDLLHDCIGLKSVEKAVVKPLKSLRLASHVGCQIVRYSDLGRADDAENPRKMDDLIRVTGAESVDYNEKLDCCGSHLMLSRPDTALSLAGGKAKAVKGLGVAGLVVSCPDCGLMFDSRQKEAGTTVGTKLDLPVLYLTQLLGLAFGVEQEKLGLQLNQSPVELLLSKVSV